MGTIDHTAYPHIFERIVQLAPRPTLLALRATSRHAKSLADWQLSRHIRITSTSRGLCVTSPNGRIPASMPGEFIRSQTFAQDFLDHLSMTLLTPALPAGTTPHFETICIGDDIPLDRSAWTGGANDHLVAAHTVIIDTLESSLQCPAHDNAFQFGNYQHMDITIPAGIPRLVVLACHCTCGSQHLPSSLNELVVIVIDPDFCGGDCDQVTQQAFEAIAIKNPHVTINLVSDCPPLYNDQEIPPNFWLYDTDTYRGEVGAMQYALERFDALPGM